MLNIALPHLLRFEYPAVLFVPTDFVGKHNSFDADVEPEEAICDWDELRELARQGISIQSHSASHRHFSELDQAEKEEELLRSKAALESGLGTPVEVISYPYGDDEISDGALEQAGYRAACLYGGGVNRLPGVSRYRLTRLAMGCDTDLRATLG